MFSRRTEWSFAPNALSHQLAELKRTKTPLIDLTLSNPTSCGLTYLQNEILRPLSKDRNLVYAPEPFGLRAARAAVSHMYAKDGLLIPEDHIVLTASTSEAYTLLFRLLCNPGEEVLLPRPSYPLFEYLARINDVAMGSYSLVYDGAWRLDIESLQAAISAKTRAIVVVSPNNPTGSFIKDEELKAINALCREHRLALIADEVFADYGFLGALKAPKAHLAGNDDVLTFSLNGLSKCLGLPQMKVSWIAASGPAQEVPDALKRLEVIADTYLSVNTPSQNAMEEWLSLKPRIQKDLKARLHENKKILDAACERKAGKSCEALNIEGGWYGILRLDESVNEEDLCLKLLSQDHVLVHPGYFFDFESGAHLVVSLLPKPRALEEGLKKILKRL